MVDMKHVEDMTCHSRIKVKGCRTGWFDLVENLEMISFLLLAKIPFCIPSFKTWEPKEVYDPDWDFGIKSIHSTWSNECIKCIKLM